MKGERLADARQRAAQWIARDREPPEISSELYRRCLKATRGLAIAEALVLIVAGFTLDDLGLLRFPGYAAGALLAVIILATGRLLHGRSLARRIAVHAPEDAQRAIDGAKLRNTLAAVGAVLLFLTWLVFFSSGVPPWIL